MWYGLNWECKVFWLTNEVEERVNIALKATALLMFLALAGCMTTGQPGVGQRFRDCAECPEMVVVPAGSVLMGSPDAEEGRDEDEGPLHRVTFAAPFAVGIYEVTFDEWNACVAGGGCGDHRLDDEGWGRGRRPVIDVSWHDALACRVAVRVDGAGLPAVERIRVGVCGTGGHGNAVPHRRDDFDGSGELRRELRLRQRSQGGGPGTDVVGGFISGEWIWVA